MIAMDFTSDTADIRAVALATSYTSYVADPAQVLLPDGAPLDPEFLGYVVERVRDRDGAQIAELHDPKTGALVLGPAGKPVQVVYRPKGSQGRALAPGLQASVSWRTESGVVLQFPGSDPGDFMAALRQALPVVNTLRLDFNARTLDNPQHVAAWRELALAAAQQGFRLIIDNADGRFSGAGLPVIRTGPDAGKKRLPLDRIGPADALRLDDGTIWGIEQVREDWLRMLDFLYRPENAAILNAVWGWELLNEPMAYGKSPEAGRIYSQHMHDLILDPRLDWGGRRILVGGLGASARFEAIDQDLLHKAAGKQLVWSAHMYPNWVTAKHIDPEQRKLMQTRRKKLPGLRGDILVTETLLPTKFGFLDPADTDRTATFGWNWARGLPALPDNGIGFTWWPVSNRRSDLIFAGSGGYDIRPVSVAFAQFAWMRHEAPPVDPDGTRHSGTAGDDDLSVDPGPGSNLSGKTLGLASTYGMLFGLQGQDRLTGSADRDMLYGGTGNDSLIGGAAGDFLFGGPQDDVMDAGDGDDIVFDPEGRNRVTGGNGDDLLEASGALDGGAGQDTLAAVPGGETLMTGGPGKDLFRPTMRARATVSDFDPAEDRIDLSIWERNKKVRRIVLQADPQGVRLSDGRGGTMLVTLPPELRGEAAIAAVRDALSGTEPAKLVTTPGEGDKS